MPHPDAVAFAEPDEPFTLELLALARLFPSLREELDAEILECIGLSWARFVRRCPFRFHEDSFDGQRSIGTLAFCEGKALILCVMTVDAIQLATFHRPRLPA